MRKIVLTILAFAFNASAQTVECPKDLRETKLSGAGAFFDRQAEIQGSRKDFKGGYNVELPLNTKWLVCEYGNLQRWEELKPSEKISSCTLHVRTSKTRSKDIKLVCK